MPARRRLAVAAAVAIACMLLPFSGAWRTLELKGFDALTVLTAPNASRFPVTVVGIDEDSFAQVREQWPWPRSLHARLVDTLAKEGALVVAFDVAFFEPDRRGPAEDEAFAAAIGRAGNVVLAADLKYVETVYARQWSRVEPLQALLAAGGVTGFARIDLDRDLVARRMPVEADAFWRRIAQRLAAQVPDVRFQEPPADAMIRYAGPIQTFQYVSYAQALEPAKLPPGLFKDQVVIVGRHLQASPEAGVAHPDVFTTPFTWTTNWFTPGAEIHANALETALRGDAIRPVPAAWVATLVALLVGGCAWLMRTWRPFVSGALALAAVAALALADWALFTRADWWLPMGAPAVGILGIYGAFGALAFLTEQQRRAELRRAFSLYVSPEVVDHVMSQPQRLALGGERRDVTMLFTDLAGFTTITEKLGAEQVAQILNRHFTGATRIIKEHHGTVSRFIGDAVMAMWGAPMDDPQQALHACQAAVAMQADAARLRGELEREGLPPIHMRIGVHACNAIIGNLGSADRLEYTAIGDGVNLAARLEGVNKLYGTGILVSGETVARVGGAVPMRPVDRVVVKGKSEPVEIFTPCGDAALVEAATRAIAAYRARRWDESELFWAQVEQRAPGDRIAAIYRERIARFRAAAPPEGWNGAVELEKL